MYRSLCSSEACTLRPNLTNGSYPENHPEELSWLDRCGIGTQGFAQQLPWTRNPSLKKVISAIDDAGQSLTGLSKQELSAKIKSLHQKLYQQGLRHHLLIQSFALIREMADRVLGMRHYPSQLMGGWVMIQGRLTEMDTGEGKTLTATLTAASAALAGIPVHIITVNEYLVSRDAQLMAPLFTALGLSTGVITSDMNNTEKQAGYSCDITYCTNKQIAFDYLRDCLQQGNNQSRSQKSLTAMLDPKGNKKPLLRGLCFAIIDEADSVLIDEARTPLLISKDCDGEDENKLYRVAMSFSRLFKNGRDYHLDPKHAKIKITEEGSILLAKLCAEAGAVWSGRRRREELLCQALSAHNLYLRDRHYLLSDGKVVIIDENTGRPMPDRSWQRGLHQMIEIKEGCSITAQRETLARLTYQRFFQRYLHLAGMTGTASEVSFELWSVYGLRTQRVPPHRPCKRQNTGATVLADRDAKWQAVLEKVKILKITGRPILIGTRSLADSEVLSHLLTQASIKHQVLNARQDAQEAEIIARAGHQGQITVATNMAGRGTDIPLGLGVAERGGLHVIATERNESSRIDRQLSGRCGRQGDPGSFEYILSLNDDLLEPISKHRGVSTLTKLLRFKLPFTQRLGLFTLGLAQRQQQQHHKQLRRELLAHDIQVGKMLAFAGQRE